MSKGCITCWLSHSTHQRNIVNVGYYAVLSLKWPNLKISKSVKIQVLVLEYCGEKCGSQINLYQIICHNLYGCYIYLTDLLYRRNRNDFLLRKTSIINDPSYTSSLLSTFDSLICGSTAPEWDISNSYAWQCALHGSGLIMMYGPRAAISRVLCVSLCSMERKTVAPIYTRTSVTEFFLEIRAYIHDYIPSLTARFMGPTGGPSGTDRTQVGLMLAPWTLLSGILFCDM